MEGEAVIAANVARLRRDRGLTQADLAAKAGLSRVAVGKIERAVVAPRWRTLAGLAAALEVRVGDLVTAVRPLESVRFRARARAHAREQILAEVSKWLDAHVGLEEALNAREPFSFGQAVGAGRGEPQAVARAARRSVGLGPEQAIRDICGLLEENGVKVLLLDTRRDSFFGLSVGEVDGGPAVVVNTWERISVERWIFTAAHELGHLLLHPAEYQRAATELPRQTEREADAFASEFLMPDAAFSKAWEGTRGHPLLVRVLKIKRIFRVSYRTVLYRLIESERETGDLWARFQNEHRKSFGRTLRKADEPAPLASSEFAWNWNRAGEPAGLSRHDFIEDRLSRLVRQAVEAERISLGRAAEILGVSLGELRTRARAWSG